MFIRFGIKCIYLDGRKLRNVDVSEQRALVPGTFIRSKESWWRAFCREQNILSVKYLTLSVDCWPRLQRIRDSRFVTESARSKIDQSYRRLYICSI